MNESQNTSGDPRRRSALLFPIAILGALALTALGVWIGWSSVRHKALSERSPAEVSEMVRKALEGAGSPLAAQAALMKLGFDQVGANDDGHLIWGVAHQTRERLNLSLHDLRVEVTLDDAAAIKNINVNKIEGGS